MLNVMRKIEKRVNLAAVILPFVATLAAIPLLWNKLVGWNDLAIFGVMYVASAIGITVGYHRMLTHRAFEAVPPVRYGLAVLGSMAVQGPVISWVADHRKHHAFADDEGDPHSPHGHGGGARGVLGGLWHAHVGWLFRSQGRAAARRFAPDLLEDQGMRWINRNFPWLVLVGLAIPSLFGFLLTGTALGALTGLLWGGLVRVFLVHHVTWSVNSICHFMGTRRFPVPDESRNVFWLAIPSLGESWHHNHHAFPRSAVQRLRWWEVDLSGLFIAGLERLGLARNVVRISPERQEERLHGAPRRAPERVREGDAQRADQTAA
jgi:stearoyl-CoA desaturase (Delta-9 desaturase)